MNNITKNLVLFPFNVLYKINPKFEIGLLYRVKSGKRISFKNPITFNEKLQWIKLYDKNPLMPECCDKFKVREYVENCGCGQILNALLWEGFDPTDIPFEKLPSQFVIKVTHGSTFNIICKDKAKLDIEKTIKKLNRWLKAKYLSCYGEWFYGIVKPRIIVEKYLEDSDSKVGGLTDYKVFCFNGETKYVGVVTGRFTDTCAHIFDADWNLMENVTKGYPCSNQPIPKPHCLNEMLEYSRKLSNKFLHARVDFYIVNQQIYFGEITFTDGAGFTKILPNEFNVEMGNCLKLPIDK